MPAPTRNPQDTQVSREDSSGIHKVALQMRIPIGLGLRNFESGWPDLNRRPLRPGANARCGHGG